MSDEVGGEKLDLGEFTLIEEVGEEEEPSTHEDEEPLTCKDEEPLTHKDEEPSTHKGEEPSTHKDEEPLTREEIADENEELHIADPNDICFNLGDDKAQDETQTKIESGTSPKNGDKDDEVEPSVKNESDDITIEDENDREEGTHPYLYLIETFQLPKDVLNFTTVGPIKTLEEKPYLWISSKLQFQKMLQSLRTAKEIGIELHMQVEEFGQPIGIISMATRDTNYLIDAIKLRNDLLMLIEIFINPQIVKIVYGVDNTLSHLQQKLHLYLVNIFDVGEAKYLLRGGSKENLAKLSKVIKKEFNCSRALLVKHDFRTRPISDDIKKFCIAGVHYLVYIYHDFKNKLLTKNADEYKKFLGRCRGACKVLYSDSKKMALKELQDELIKRHKCELDVLKKLFAWRNTVARRRNIKPDAVINDLWLIKVVKDLPVDSLYVDTLPSKAHLRSEWYKVKKIIEDSKASFKIRDVAKPNQTNVVNKPQKRKMFDQVGPPQKQSFVSNQGKKKRFHQNNDTFTSNRFFNQNPNGNHSRFETPEKRQPEMFNYNMHMSTPMVVNPTNAPATYPFQSPMNITPVGNQFVGRVSQEEDTLRTSIANLKEASANIRRQVSNNEEDMLYRSLVDLKQARDSVRRQCGNLSGNFNTRKYQDLESINQEISRLERQVKDVQGRSSRSRFNDNSTAFSRRY